MPSPPTGLKRERQELLVTLRIENSSSNVGVLSKTRREGLMHKLLHLQLKAPKPRTQVRQTPAAILPKFKKNPCRFFSIHRRHACHFLLNPM